MGIEGFFAEDTRIPTGPTPDESILYGEGGQFFDDLIANVTALIPPARAYLARLDLRAEIHHADKLLKEYTN